MRSRPKLQGNIQLLKQKQDGSRSTGNGKQISARGAALALHTKIEMIISCRGNWSGSVPAMVDFNCFFSSCKPGFSPCPSISMKCSSLDCFIND